MTYQGYINSVGKIYKLVSRKIMLRGGKERLIYYFKPCEAKLTTYETEGNTCRKNTIFLKTNVTIRG